MLRIIALIVVSSLVLLGCSQKDSHEGHDHSNMKMEKQEKMATVMEEKLIYYTCPMDEHKHVHSREAGKCSECGMDMVAGVITSEEQMEFWGCPMEAHAHVRLDEAGTCEDCGMQLKPMRLKQL